MKYLKTYKLFEEFEYGFADAQRMDTITDFIKKLKEEGEDYSPEDPDYDELLDPYDGYNDQTYIQNIGTDIIIYYEGWSSLCWDALYQKPEYKGLSKEEALEKFLNERVPIIVREVGCIIIDSGYEWYESWKEDVDDGYVTFVKMKIDN